MITPTAYNDFILSGRKDITSFQTPADPNKGVFLVAQSGGINNSTSKRASGFELDYYIDNLKILSNISGKTTQTSTSIEEITFDIIEPYGFSFLSNLKKALDALNAGAAAPATATVRDPNGAYRGDRTEIAAVRDPNGAYRGDRTEVKPATPAPTSGSNTTPSNSNKVENPQRQFFILGIRFQGYDKDGNLISSKDEIGYNGDPAGNANGVYQRFYDIKIQDLKFKLDGKAVVYHCTAVPPIISEVLSTKNGILDNGVTMIGGTVDDAFMGNSDGKIGMFTKLNNDQIKLFNEGKIQKPNRYKVTYLGDTDQTIGQASIVSEADLDKLKWKMNNAANTAESNIITEESAKPVPNERQITIMRGTPILQAIQQVITQSAFLENALTVIYKSNDESEGEVPTAGKNNISWYNVTPEITNLGWDEKQSDFAYEINYVFQPYSTPVVTSPYIKKTPPYYGPFKRYEYTFTGKNSEVLSFQLNFDLAYFNVAISPSINEQSHGGSQQIPTKANKEQNQSKTGAQGDGKQSQNSYLTSLFEPGAYAEGKIKILGDPDFLMTTSASSVREVYNRFYGPDGYTVNPNGGQVFIEINFKEPQDYKNSTGLMSINDSILFYKYSDDIQAQIAKRGGGISYLVKVARSTFQGGKFEQELDLTQSDLSKTDETKTDAGRPAASPTASPTGLVADQFQSQAEINRLKAANSLLAKAETGFTQNTPYTAPEDTIDGVVAFNSPNLKYSQNQTKTVPTKTGRVQDDDGGVNYNYF
jgi:hypothetical protein